MGSMDARTVAEDGYRALMAGKPVMQFPDSRIGWWRNRCASPREAW
jgi:hypothetical protein